MDSYGSVWTRIGPYGSWGLPGGFLGPPGALGGPRRGGKQVLGFGGLGWGGVLTYLSEDPSLTTYFFPGRDGLGDGDSQVCRRRRRDLPNGR